eukprot:scaffold4511_cov146-Isochrysis_galbana.AAC.1
MSMPAAERMRRVHGAGAADVSLSTGRLMAATKPKLPSRLRGHIDASEPSLVRPNRTTTSN